MLLGDENSPFLPIVACAKPRHDRKGRYHEENGQGGPSPQASSSELARILETRRARSHLAAGEPVRQPNVRSPAGLVHQTSASVLDLHGLVAAGTTYPTISRRFRADLPPVLSTPSVRQNLSGVDPGDWANGAGGVYRVWAMPASDDSESRGHCLDLVWLDGLRGRWFASGRAADPTQRETLGQSRPRQDASASGGSLD